MKADQLRKAILNLAIQGKLVSQNPSDEPASVLLEKIKAEKQRLIKDGKIKKNKYDSVIFKGDDNCYYEKIGNNLKNIDEEVSDFYLPENWCLCRFNIIASIYTGNSINAMEKQKKYTGLKSGYNYISTKDLNFDHSINYNNGIKIPFSNNKFRIAHKFTTILCIEGGSAGRKIGILSEDVCFGNKLCAFQPFGINSLYLYYYLQNPKFIDVFKVKTTGIIGGVGINTIKSLLFALPPLAEQERIVAEIEKYEPIIAAYDKLETEATKLDNEIKYKLKKSILQYAIQGKLVNQNSNDEPASVLLEKIRTEKKAKLGKKFVDSIIYKGDDDCYYEKIGNEINNISNEIPFDIPNNWVWAYVYNTVSINPFNRISDEIEASFVTMKDIKDGFNDEFKYEIRSWKNIKKGYRHFIDGDIGFAKITPCFQNRKSVTFKNLKNGIGAGTTELHILRPYNNTMYAEYLLWFLKTPYLIHYGIKNFRGTAGQQRFGTDKLKNTILPIPPLVEQKRIATQIDKMFAIIDKTAVVKISKITKVDAKERATEIIENNKPQQLRKSLDDFEVAARNIKGVSSQTVENAIKQIRDYYDKKD